MAPTLTSHGRKAPRALIGLLPLLLALAACGDDENPVRPRTPGTTVATTVAELVDALENAVAGDTIEIRAEFASPQFNLDQGYSFSADQSPLRIVGTPRALFSRPEIIFPDGVDGLTFTEHSGSELLDLDITGGRDAVVLIDSNVAIEGILFSGQQRDCISARGTGSRGTVELCLFETPARFGVFTSNGSTVNLVRNTVIGAGDCGFFLGSNATVTANNVVGSVQFGIICSSGTPTLDCNNSFDSGVANYECPQLIDLGKSNFELDPLFCPGGYRLSEASPLNDRGCEIQPIGAFGVEPTCLPE